MSRESSLGAGFLGVLLAGALGAPSWASSAQEQFGVVLRSSDGGGALTDRIRIQSQIGLSRILMVDAYLDLGGQRARNAGDPIDPQDLATKAYVDATVGGDSVDRFASVGDTGGPLFSASGSDTLNFMAGNGLAVDFHIPLKLVVYSIVPGAVTDAHLSGGIDPSKIAGTALTQTTTFGSDPASDASVSGTFDALNIQLNANHFTSVGNGNTGIEQFSASGDDMVWFSSGEGLTVSFNQIANVVSYGVSAGSITDAHLFGGIDPSKIAGTALTQTTTFGSDPASDATVTGTFSALNVQVNDVWLDAAGDVLSGPLTGSGTINLTGTAVEQVRAATIELTGTAVHGEALYRGVFGEASSIGSAAGVVGVATGATGEVYGVWGSSMSTEGIGVYGWVPSGTGSTVGVLGRSVSLDGIGVKGENQVGGWAGKFLGPVRVEGAGSSAFSEWATAEAAPAAAPAGTGRLYFDGTRFLISEGGESYGAIMTGGTGVSVLWPSETPPVGYTYSGDYVLSDASLWNDMFSPGIPLSPMITPRFDGGAVQVGDKVYLIGGSTSPGVASAKNEAYDPVTNQWTALDDMPTVRSSLVVKAVGNWIYCIGGTTDGTNVLDTNECYDPATDNWVPGFAPMPTARRGLAGDVVSGRIYCIGGYNPSFFPASAAYLAYVEEFDPSAGPQGTWEAKAAMPTARGWLAAVSCGGKIYAIGGYGSGMVPLSVNEEFDPSAGPSGTWVTKAAMPTARYYVSGAVHEGRVHAVGGYTGTTRLRAHEEFDAASNSWVPRAYLPVALQAPIAATWGTTMYVFGGYSPTGVVPTTLRYEGGKTYYIHTKE